MPKMIQIRNVPAGVHAKIKARAALARKSLSDYLLDQILEMLERPTWEEFRRRLPDYGDRLDFSVADLVREERDHR